MQLSSEVIELILGLIAMLGGLAMFLYGMQIMGNGLEKLSGSRLERTLEKMTDSPVKGVVLGALVTAVLQSSSATTVMVVGFVNSGILALEQSIGVIMGANIGTTLTTWLTALTGLEGDSLAVQLCKPANFSPLLALLGIVLVMLCKQGKKRDIGEVLLGFAILMFGMTAMSEGTAPLADQPWFNDMFLIFNNPIFGLLIGAVLTGIIQSSAAAIGILQTLSAAGKMTYSMGIPIIMGQNIGTCVTALLSCVGTNKNAKRTAMVHLYFNIIGSVIFLTGYFAINALIDLPFANQPLDHFGIALIHTIFNVLTTLIMLPMYKLLGRLARWTVKDKAEEKEAYLLDERLLATPSFALEQCGKRTSDMAILAKETLRLAIAQQGKYDPKLAAEIVQNEDKLDEYEDHLGNYMVQLSSRELSMNDSTQVAHLLHSLGDFERIGDHAVNVLKTAEELYEKKLSFSPQAKEEVAVLQQAVLDIVEMTCNAFVNRDIQLAMQVEPLEQVIDRMKAELKIRHIHRLQAGECTIEMGFILSDLLTNYGRVSDHCSNIAVRLIQTKQPAFETHEYLNGVKNTGDPAFEAQYQAYLASYPLPEVVAETV